MAIFKLPPFLQPAKSLLNSGVRIAAGWLSGFFKKVEEGPNVFAAVVQAPTDPATEQADSGTVLIEVVKRPTN